MRAKIYLKFAVIALVIIPASLQAQSARIPAELPPATYKELQYIDSDGCAFIRAQLGGVLNWVPRVDRKRQPLCNFQPTFTKPASAAQVASVAKPIDQSLILKVSAEANIATPQITRVDVPKQSQTSAKRRLTLKQACEEMAKTGRPLINSATGKSVACSSSSTASAVVEKASLQAGFTVEQICKEQKITGRKYVDQATGQPIECDKNSQQSVEQLTFVDASEVSVARGYNDQECLGSSTDVSGDQVKCISQDTNIVPAAILNLVEEAPINIRQEALRSIPFLMKKAVPASNPLHVSKREIVKPPRGYEQVWSDGRHNINRGLPSANY